MSRIKKPTDLLIRETALKILWELHNSNRPISVWEISKNTGIDKSLVYDNIKRWKNSGILCGISNKGYMYYSLNPEIFKFTANTIEFWVNSMKISVEKRVS